MVILEKLEFRRLSFLAMYMRLYLFQLAISKQSEFSRQALAALSFRANKTFENLPTSLKEKRKDIFRQHISKFR